MKCQNSKPQTTKTPESTSPSSATTLRELLDSTIRRKITLFSVKYEEKYKSMGHSGALRRMTILVMILTATGPCDMKPAFAQIDPVQAVRAIVGEAEDQGLTGMTAVAEAIRNRGHLNGVYGVKSPRLKKAPKWVFDMAEKAWEKSQSTNLVKGASFWESTDFKKPYWAKDMTETARIGKHVFYREVVK